VKVHDNNPGNELADQLAKEAACDNSLETTYHKYPKSSVTSELKCLGIKRLQSEWDNTNKGALTKTFFPTTKDRLTKRLQMNLNLSTIVTGHGKLRSYLYRFKIIYDPTCPCQTGSQSTEHLIRKCTILNKQRDTIKNGITNAGGSWPLSNSELATV
jgi:hypothetical protein